MKFTINRADKLGCGGLILFGIIWLIMSVLFNAVGGLVLGGILYLLYRFVLMGLIGGPFIAFWIFWICSTALLFIVGMLRPSSK